MKINASIYVLQEKYFSRQSSQRSTFCVKLSDSMFYRNKYFEIFHVKMKLLVYILFKTRKFSTSSVL